MKNNRVLQINSQAFSKTNAAWVKNALCASRNRSYVNEKNVKKYLRNYFSYGENYILTKPVEKIDRKVKNLDFCGVYSPNNCFSSFIKEHFPILHTAFDGSHNSFFVLKANNGYYFIPLIVLKKENLDDYVFYAHEEHIKKMTGFNGESCPPIPVIVNTWVSGKDECFMYLVAEGFIISR